MPTYGTVTRTEQLTPRLVRVVMDGDGLSGYTPAPFTDSYVNIALPRPGATYAAPFDVDALNAELPRELRPARRRYTIRSWDPSQRLLTIDFVVHGEHGIAGRWAASARPGDVLQFSGPTGAYNPSTDADWHLMVGDESALPAIAASLEAVADGVPVVARLVCDGPGHEVPLETPGRLDLAWLHRTGAVSHVDLLFDAVRDLSFFPGAVHGFVHGEAEEIRRVRRHLLRERKVPMQMLSASPYWRRTMTDEAWREVKAAWVAEMERDS